MKVRKFYNKMEKKINNIYNATYLIILKFQLLWKLCNFLEKSINI